MGTSSVPSSPPPPAGSGHFMGSRERPNHVLPTRKPPKVDTDSLLCYRRPQAADTERARRPAMEQTLQVLDARQIVSRYVRLKPMLAALLGLFALFAAARLYQQAFAWYAGTDATSPLFAKYWLSVFYAETIAAL